MVTLYTYFRGKIFLLSVLAATLVASSLSFNNTNIEHMTSAANDNVPKLQTDALASSQAFQLGFSTYLGGSLEDSIRGVATDAQGNIYVTGGAQSRDFPITEGPSFGSGTCSSIGSFGPMDAFVAKFSPTGKRLWSRFVGGPCYDRAYAIQVDKQGYVYIAGRAGDGFPVTSGVIQPKFGGGSGSGKYGSQDGFITMLSPDGSRIVWSTYFGGADDSFIRDMALDGLGNVYIAMGDVAQSNPHITSNAFQTTLGGGTDALVAKISNDGTKVIWATYFGGSNDDGIGPSIKVDSNGYVFLEGSTKSTNLPLSHAYQAKFGGTMDFYLAKFTPTGSALVFSTYFGGSGEESTETHHVALDSQGNAFISGYVNSTNFPVTPGAFQKSLGGGYDSGIAKFSPTGRLLASTYLGGSGDESPQGIAVDSTGNLVLFGGTQSTNYPLTPTSYQLRNAGADDFFITKLSPDLKTLIYSTYFGGGLLDQARAGAIDADDSIIAGGWTLSTNFPTKGAFQSGLHGNYDAALVKFTSGSGGSSQSIYLPFIINGQ